MGGGEGVFCTGVADLGEGAAALGAGDGDPRGEADFTEGVAVLWGSDWGCSLSSAVTDSAVNSPAATLRKSKRNSCYYSQ